MMRGEVFTCVGRIDGLPVCPGRGRDCRSRVLLGRRRHEQLARERLSMGSDKGGEGTDGRQEEAGGRKRRRGARTASAPGSSTS